MQLLHLRGETITAPLMKDPKEPRAHHYLPRCWLAGFTKTGQKDGRLWVTDLKRTSQWSSSPPNAGHSRDFHRISDPGADPVAVENFYSKIEDKIAPILKSLDQEKRPPTKNELEGLCFFMAIQWSRVPAFRSTMLDIAHRVDKANMAKALKSRDSWKRMLKKLRVPLDNPEADYDKMKDFVESEQYSLYAENEWYVQQGIESIQIAFPSLLSRQWQTYISQKGSFIASDNPVVLDSEKNQMIGIANAEVIIYPLSRHVLLQGTRFEASRQFLNELLIARFNTLMMLSAHEQVFSWKPDFCWLSHSERYQTDWKLFAKDKF